MPIALAIQNQSFNYPVKMALKSLTPDMQPQQKAVVAVYVGVIKIICFRDVMRHI